MDPSNLPQKRTQKIIQPTSTDLEPTTVNTVSTTPSSIYPTAADDIPTLPDQEDTPAPAAHTWTPHITQPAEQPGQLSSEKQKIYDQYVENRAAAPKRTERILLAIAIYLLVGTGINLLLSVIALGIAAASGNFELAGLAVGNIIFSFIPFVFALYFYRRNEFTRFVIRLLLFVSFIGMTFYIVQLAQAIVSIGDMSSKIAMISTPSIYGAVALFIVHLYIFIFLGRQDVRRLFN